MKNILLKSAQVFVLMSIMNFLLSAFLLNIGGFPGGNFGMYPLLIFIEGMVASVIAFITVVLFKQNYHSVLRIAILYQSIYLITIILSGFNPFGINDINTFSLLLYVNSFIVFLVIYLVPLVYSKIISSRSGK